MDLAATPEFAHFMVLAGIVGIFVLALIVIYLLVLGFAALMGWRIR